MSVMCSIYVPEGIIMAAESRITAVAQLQRNDDIKANSANIFTVSDNAQKLMLLDKTKTGIAACGLGILDDTTVADYIRVFEIKELTAYDTVSDVANKLKKYVQKYAKQVQFHVAGYDNDEPFVYSVVNGECKRVNLVGGDVIYGAAWNGEPIAIHKLLNGEPKMTTNFKLMPLKDAVDFADFLIQTTIDYQRFEMKPKTCGGSIDILVLTKDDGFWHRHKVFLPKR